MNNYAYLGIAGAGSLNVVAAEDGRPGPYRLTTAPADEQPESGEIKLADFDQKALFVRGIGRDGWIYGASIVEEAGPILTLTVSAVFSPGALVFQGG